MSTVYIFVTLFLAVAIGCYFYLSKLPQIRRIVKNTLCESLKGIPLGAYIRYVKNGQKKYVFFNSKAQDIFSQEDVLSSPLWKQDQDDKADDVLINQLQAYTSSEKIINSSSNHRRYVRFNKQICRINANEYFIITTIHDTTEKKVLQLEIEENHKDISMAMHAGEILIWIYHPETELFTPIIGKPVVEGGVKLNGVISMVHPDDRQALLDLINSLIRADIQEGDITVRLFDQEQKRYLYYEAKMHHRFDPVKQLVYIIGSQRNVTDKFLQQLGLNTISKNINLAMDAAEITIWDYNINTQKYRFLYKKEDITIEREAIDSNEVLEKMHPEDRASYADFIHDLVEKRVLGNKGIIEVRILKDEVDYAIYKCTIQLIYDSDEESEYVIGTFIDITKQKEDETTIRENMNFLQTLLDNIPFSVHVKDVLNEQKYFLWNNANTKLFGDCSNKPLASILDKNDAEKMEEVDLEILKTGNVYHKQETLHMLDGRTIHTIAHKSVICNGEQKLVLTVRWDIGNMLELQRNLEEVCRRNEIIINNINSGLAYITTDYMVQWENISICSPHLAYETYRQGELCYKSAYGRDLPCDDCLLRRAMESKMIEQREFNLPNDRHVEVLANPVLNDSGEIEGIVIRMDDITERQKMIQDLKIAKEKAEESDLLKSSFIANMTHEIRTPLNAIVGFSELLITTSNDEEKKQYAEVISVNNDLLLRLINDILDLSQIDSGMIHINMEDVNVSDLFNEITGSFAHKTPANVDFICENPYKKCMFQAELGRLRQIISQFLINAIKFTTDGQIKIGYEVVDGGLRCYVSDTGIGIKEESRKMIFERFEKVNRYIQGTGLGLPICKSIVDAYGGQIGVDSEYGKGSTFWIWLPGESVIS